jgi:N-acetylneuraminate lyase
MFILPTKCSGVGRSAWGWHGINDDERQPGDILGNNVMKTRFTGLVAAPFTPLNKDGSINLPMIKPLAAALVENQVGGAFVCGTTGEGMSLTTDERQQVAESWMAVAPPALRVVVHVGHHTVAESCTLAAHAEKIKAHAFATLGPTFFPVTNAEQLVDYCAPIAAAAPSLPFYYYHMPSLTRADVPMYDFLKAASRRIPNLAGIKFTYENLMDYARCLKFEEGRFNILFGRDEILLAALALGATGAVGSTYNYMAPVYHQVIQAFNAGDLESARRFQSLAIRIIAVMSRRGGLPAAKAMMKMIGLDCGPVRPPLTNPSAETVETFTHELEQAGFPGSFVKSGAFAPALVH